MVDGGSLAFGQWDGEANRLARGLVAAGIRPDDRVALHLRPENALRWLTAYAAVHRAGGVAVPLNPRLAPDEVARMLAHSGARAVLADEERVELDAGSGVGSGGAGAAGTAGEAPGGRAGLRLVVDATLASPGPPGRAGQSTGGGAPVPAIVAWSEVLADDASAFQVERKDDDLADILYTSGTTGRPKGVAVRHVNASLVPPMAPSYTGGGLAARQPHVHLRRPGLHLQPDEARPARHLPPPLRRRALAGGRRERATGGGLPGAGDGPAAARPPRASTRPTCRASRCARSAAPRWPPSSSSACRSACPTAVVSNNYGMTEAGSVYCITPKGEAMPPTGLRRPAGAAGRGAHRGRRRGRARRPARSARSGSRSRAGPASTSATPRQLPRPGSTAG